MSSDLPMAQMILIAVVPVLSLVVWLASVYLAARAPRHQAVGAVPTTPGIDRAAAAKETEKQAA